VQGSAADAHATVIDNLHRFVVPKIAGPARLVPLASLATPAFSYDVLRQAARLGRSTPGCPP